MGDIWLGGGTIPLLVMKAACCALEGRGTGDVDATIVIVPWHLLLLEVLGTLWSEPPMVDAKKRGLAHDELIAMKNCCVALCGLVEICSLTSKERQNHDYGGGKHVAAFIQGAMLWQPEVTSTVGTLATVEACAAILDDWSFPTDVERDPFFHTSRDDEGDHEDRKVKQLRGIVALVARAALRLRADARAARVAKDAGNRCVDKEREPDWVQASAYYRAAMTLDPRNATNLCNMAISCLNRHAYLAADSYASCALGVDPDSVKALYLKAKANLELGYVTALSHDFAEGFLRKKDPKLSNIQARWRKAKLKDGTEDDAIRASREFDDYESDVQKRQFDEPREAAVRAMIFVETQRETNESETIKRAMIQSVRYGNLAYFPDLAPRGDNRLICYDVLARLRVHNVDHTYLTMTAEGFHDHAIQFMQAGDLRYDLLSHSVFFSLLAWLSTDRFDQDHGDYTNKLLQRSSSTFAALQKHRIPWKPSHRQFWASLFWRVARPDVASFLENKWHGIYQHAESPLDAGPCVHAGYEYFLQTKSLLPPFTPPLPV